MAAKRYVSPSHHNLPPSTPTYQFPHITTILSIRDWQLHLREVIMPRHTCTSAIWGRGQAIRLGPRYLRRVRALGGRNDVGSSWRSFKRGEAAIKPGCRHSGSEPYLQAVPAWASLADVASKLLLTQAPGPSYHRLLALVEVIDCLPSGCQGKQSYFWPTTDLYLFRSWPFCSPKSCFWRLNTSDIFRCLPEFGRHARQRVVKKT